MREDDGCAPREHPAHDDARPDGRTELRRGVAGRTIAEFKQDDPSPTGPRR